MNAPLAGLPEIDVSSCTSLPPASGSPVTGTVFSVSKSVNDQFSPLEAGDVPLIPLGGTVEWYQYEGSYVVQYPLSLSTAGPLCLGNSIAVGSEFLHVSDSPPEVGACDVPAILDNPDVLATPPAGAYACGADIYYLTEIPTTATGFLYASGGRFLEPPERTGFTAIVVSDVASTPQSSTFRAAPCCR